MQGEHLATRLEDPTCGGLDEFVAQVAEVFSPARACNVITALGQLLIDEHPNHPQALLDRARRPGRSLGPLARSLEAFFTEGGLAMATDHAVQLAAGRRKRRTDAVPATLRPAVVSFAESLLTARVRAHRAGTLPRSDRTIESRWRPCVISPCFWITNEENRTGPRLMSVTSRGFSTCSPTTARGD